MVAASAAGAAARALMSRAAPRPPLAPLLVLLRGWLAARMLLLPLGRISGDEADDDGLGPEGEAPLLAAAAAGCGSCGAEPSSGRAGHGGKTRCPAPTLEWRAAGPREAWRMAPDDCMLAAACAAPDYDD